MSIDPGSQPPQRPLDYWHDLSSARRRWVRENFNREAMVHMLRTLAWVAPLSVLIWFWAEREQMVTDYGVPFPIDVRATDSGKRLVTLVRPADKNIVAELFGSRAKLDLVRKKLGEPKGSFALVQIDIDPNLQPGKIHELKTSEYVASLGIFRDNGIIVRNCQPPTLQVFVDSIEEREVPVQAPPGENNLDSVVFDPPAVKVRGPASVLAQGVGRPMVYASLTGLPALSAPGTHELAAVPLTTPLQDEHVTISPNSVKATLKVRQSNVEYKVASMPVFLVSPAGLLEKYKVEYVPFLTNVTLVGPPEKIKVIQSPDFAPKPKATLEISREDAGKTEKLSRQVHYELPADIQVKEEDKKREVEFKLIERGPGE